MVNIGAAYNTYTNNGLYDDGSRVQGTLIRADGTAVNGVDSYGRRVTSGNTAGQRYITNPEAQFMNGNYTASAEELIARWKMGYPLTEEEREIVRQWLMRNGGGYYDDLSDPEVFNKAMTGLSNTEIQKQRENQLAAQYSRGSGGGGGSGREDYPGQSTGKNRYKFLTGGKVYDRETGKMISEFQARNS